ncbi:MAG: hypothetical protein OZ922_06095 [Myxococcales bacterium]|jgi:hypothetical protein|nr:hypothetical protein [Myxococcales bacterium]
MAESKHVSRARPQRNLQLLALEEALATWLLPATGVTLLAIATLLDALDILADPSAALLAVVALLLLAVSAVIGPLLSDVRSSHVASAVLIAGAAAWITIFAIPFAIRLFPGAPVATVAFEPRHTGESLALGSGRFDLVLDAHLPVASDRQNRELHYALTLTDAAGASQRLDGELGDRWQTRRLGRRGTAPVHLEHLSASYPIDNPSGKSLRVDDVTLSGVSNATLSGTFYRHRIPGEIWLLSAGTLLTLSALAFDLWSDPQRTPATALATAAATGAVLVFCGSATGHPGLRQIFGSTIVGGIGGVPITALVAWLARRSSWIRALTTRRAS